MKRLIALTLTLLTLTAAVVVAQVPAETTRALTAAGYRVTGTRSEGGLPTWDVQTASGQPLSVSVIGTFGSTRVAALDALSEVIFSLQGLVIERTRVVFERDRVTAVVIPRRYVIDGIEYSQYMPSGMQFVYVDSVAFDFRMLAENLALRINGQYLTEDQFRSRLVRAIANPAAFVQSSDPQFLARRLDEQQGDIDRLRAESNAADGTLAERLDAAEGAAVAGFEAVTSRIDDEVARGEMVIAEQVARGEAAYAEVVAEITALRDELAAEIAAVRAEAAELAMSGDTLRDEFEAARAGSVILAARTLFGALRDIDPATIARVVALRTAEPDLGISDARDRVNAELAEGTPQLHLRHIEAIYVLWFNDWE